MYRRVVPLARRGTRLVCTGPSLVQSAKSRRKAWRHRANTSPTVDGCCHQEGASNTLCCYYCYQPLPYREIALNLSSAALVHRRLRGFSLLFQPRVTSEYVAGCLKARFSSVQHPILGGRGAGSSLFLRCYCRFLSRYFVANADCRFAHTLTSMALTFSGYTAVQPHKKIGNSMTLARTHRDMTCLGTHLIPPPRAYG